MLSLWDRVGFWVVGVLITCLLLSILDRHTNGK